MKGEKETVVRKIQQENSEAANCRRQIAIASAVGIIDFIPISLYQLGVIKSLPDFPGPVFDSNYVNASKEAEVFGQPDGPVSLAMYAANLIVAGAAIKKKKKKNIFDYMLAANSVAQAVAGGYYLYVMTRKQKKICPYCVAGAAINFTALVPLYRLFRGKKR